MTSAPTMAQQPDQLVERHGALLEGTDYTVDLSTGGRTATRPPAGECQQHQWPALVYNCTRRTPTPRCGRQLAGTGRISGLGAGMAAGNAITHVVYGQLLPPQHRRDRRRFVHRHDHGHGHLLIRAAVFQRCILASSRRRQPSGCRRRRLRRHVLDLAAAGELSASPGPALSRSVTRNRPRSSCRPRSCSGSRLTPGKARAHA